ncbi:hypothetical protein QCA50_018476 [Cerrena zonata]|uniref:Uncharacterized protein n=1 Tax=Cerrena zonata TaxID=2478898 RepID=A0AAW0FCV2_9APHY
MSTSLSAIKGTYIWSEYTKADCSFDLTNKIVTSAPSDLTPMSIRHIPANDVAPNAPLFSREIKAIQCF